LGLSDVKKGVLRMGFMGMSSFRQIFNLQIPKGVLFYPDCGKDTYEPISLFIDSIREFHFADTGKIVLPTLECGVERGNRSLQNNWSIRSDDMSKGFISAQVIHTATEEGTKYYTYSAGESFKKYFNLDIGNLNIKYSLKKQIWRLAIQDEEEISIYTHNLDPVFAALKLDNIAVFYSKSHKGSQREKRKCLPNSDLFKIIIDKLENGGFVLTDYYKIEDSRLKYIGNCGKACKPLHVWQAIK
jgi:hypothetical protein